VQIPNASQSATGFSVRSWRIADVTKEDPGETGLQGGGTDRFGWEQAVAPGTDCVWDDHLGWDGPRAKSGPCSGIWLAYGPVWAPGVCFGRYCGYTVAYTFGAGTLPAWVTCSRRGFLLGGRPQPDSSTDIVWSFERE